ncbi:MAG TPA: metallophosphoesterase family protein [Kiritimatiellia bacterium]|nr:metallophosphoesterase family protein [Kiritimatiellia bacterium]HPS09034.1 metallophosphoesterase family protein [Kiritimatiellia bacterium]
MTRREFMASGGAFAALKGWCENATAGIPGYYRDYLEEVRRRVERAAAESSHSFWFITDLHTPANALKSGALLADLVKTTPVGTAISGGDLCEAFGAKESIDRTAAQWRELWVRSVESAGGRVLAAKGNHDFTIRFSPTASEGHTYGGREARDIIMDTAACRRAVTNAADPEACYYYLDDAKAKIRTVVADTSDSIDPNRSFWAVRYGMGERQLRWLAENAFAEVPSGWSLAVIHHIPISKVVGNDQEETLFAPFRDLLEAYQNRERVVLFGCTYDFTSAKGRILLDLSGHHHSERAVYRRGILHVTEPCDAAYEDYKFASLACGEMPTKTRGTIYEQTFDCVHLDPEHDVVRFTRVGGGTDRIYRLKPLWLVAEQKAEGQFDGVVDCDFAAVRRHPTRKYTSLYDFRSTYAKLAQGSLVACTPGTALAWRVQSDGTREFVPVIVRGT